jgi:hypothetical protein
MGYENVLQKVMLVSIHNDVIGHSTFTFYCEKVFKIYTNSL